MKHKHLIAAVSTWALAVTVAQADVIRLTDGSVLEGQLSEPGDVTITTSEGTKRVAFSLLPLELQKVYWPGAAKARAVVEGKAGMVPTAITPLADEELAALANEVNLETWAQVAAIGSFRDKPEKRGPGGLVVAKAFNALDENWVSVYSPKDAVGQAGNWGEQVARARGMQERAQQFMQKRFLELFIKAGEAVSQRNSGEFALAVRELKRSHGALTTHAAGENTLKFFTAK